MKHPLIAVALLAAAGCKINIDESIPYRCTAEGDCGGGGFKCIDGKFCCKPDGTEADHGCDGVDNDCNGLVDDGFPNETCNGVDDDCNGKIDDTFDLIQDPANCGMCNRACQSNQGCSNGVCVTRGETSCVNMLDDDNDAKIDCADPDCNLQGCGQGCQCRSLGKAEGSCTDGLDNDGDSKIDCADVDCEGAGCTTPGCRCENLAKKETDCADGMDNDGDGPSDCADPDCAGSRCQALPSTFTCGGGACSCNDGGTVMETGALCRDRVDNDCDGLVDCAEGGCDAVSCAADAGPGCVCNGGVAKETICNDRKDNDNDGQTDCADSLPDGGGDCPINTACTYLNGGGMVRTGTCAADHTCK